MSKTNERGFTLIELLTVVVIVGVLATLAGYGVRKYLFAAKSSEAMTLMNAIKAAQETYKDETYAYLDVSGSDLAPLYPGDPGAKKMAWWNPSHADYANWRQLGADASGPVTFGYACTAGGAKDALPSITTQQNLNFPTPTEPWYVIKAVGDQNGDGIQSLVVASSFTREIYVENDSE